MTDTTDTVQNRSEIVFLYDAVDANPNGNPLSGENRPRIDPVTNQAVVTDVRLKRYLRDQLEDDGHGVIELVAEVSLQANVGDDSLLGLRVDPRTVGPAQRVAVRVRVDGVVQKDDFGAVLDGVCSVGHC